MLKLEQLLCYYLCSNLQGLPSQNCELSTNLVIIFIVEKVIHQILTGVLMFIHWYFSNQAVRAETILHLFQLQSNHAAHYQNLANRLSFNYHLQRYYDLIILENRSFMAHKSLHNLSPFSQFHRNSLSLLGFFLIFYSFLQTGFQY